MANPYAVVRGAFNLTDTETVVISRDVDDGAGLGGRTPTTIYSGSCDLQEKKGATYIGIGGAVDQSDATLTIDPLAGVLPDVKQGDKVTTSAVEDGVTQTKIWTLISSSLWGGPIPHLELLLKRGGINSRPTPR